MLSSRSAAGEQEYWLVQCAGTRDYSHHPTRSRQCWGISSNWGAGNDIFGRQLWGGAVRCFGLSIRRLTDFGCLLRGTASRVIWPTVYLRGLMRREESLTCLRQDWWRWWDSDADACAGVKQLAHAHELAATFSSPPLFSLSSPFSYSPLAMGTCTGCAHMPLWIGRRVRGPPATRRGL